MIFGYGPLHAQHDFHSGNLNTEHWMTSEGLASVIWDSKGRERKVPVISQEAFHVYYVLFLNLISRNNSVGSSTSVKLLMDLKYL